ncbi:hypothetical protein SCLCIDRAFT_1192164 [Scleroderma citrinum Foug A]|uniref:DNA2/NAM7 helicase-like C-terminal domain-containing protein n=1 Tax=Scleroderma citrinum Foug A TaxID=1036808 RepID=A0A0C3E3V3_9AGAM|nr:hypothetical protein SCLCIDRAFT_1192164 [Scleroderma citrinum Foug A]
MIHGPPGTGKTTVIAAAVTSLHLADHERSVWIAAQSNVAVKNIAEKLCDVGFHDFKLLVSKDFHFDWHEHLYGDILQANFIRSDNFNKDIVGAARQLLDARVILCTLTMLSNPSIAAYTRIAPVHTVMFDEASQIEVGDYIPVIHRFSSTLRKFVFIGDNKQHRLPCVIGDFISQNVYHGQLTTCHNITDRKACRFIDVKGGNEVKQGHSWVNRGEAMIVCRLARLYEDRNKSYRIITPYDAQRTAIEVGLKNASLRWANRVFNVDSFQGNESDHIIVSVVRSRNIGFLQNERRTNVMLTRCKQSMIICTSRAFMSSAQASRTLIGRLAASLGPGAWIEGRNVLNGNLS